MPKVTDEKRLENHRYYVEKTIAKRQKLSEEKKAIRAKIEAEKLAKYAEKEKAKQALINNTYNPPKAPKMPKPKPDNPLDEYVKALDPNFRPSTYTGNGIEEVHGGSDSTSLNDPDILGKLGPLTPEEKAKKRNPLDEAIEYQRSLG